MKAWALLACLCAARLSALSVAQFSDEPFDLPVAPAIPVVVDREAWATVGIRAWSDRTLGPQALDAEALDKDGQLLQRHRDLASVAPFAPGALSKVTLLLPAGTRSLRLRVRGQGPAVGSWELNAEPVAVWAADPRQDRSLSFEGKGFELRARGGADSMELLRVGARVARLRWDTGWSVQAHLAGANGSHGSRKHIWLLQGPQNQRGLLHLMASAALDGPAKLSLGLELQGSASQDLALWFEPEGRGDWLLPFNQGLQVPSEQAAALDPSHDLDLRAGHFISMPGLGWSQTQGTVLLLAGQAHDQALRLRLADKKIAWVFRTPLRAWQDGQSIQIALLPPGVVPWAQAIRKDQEALQPLGDAPLPEPLRGAVNIHYWKKVAWWNNEPRPEALAAEMKAAGLDRVLWSQKVAPEAVTPMAALGWLLGSYENFQDLYPSDTPMSWVNKAGWPEQAVRLWHGGWMKGWPHKEGGKTYYAGVRSSRAAVGYVRAEVDARKRHGQHAVFFDTTTASGPVEDWDPLHPMTRSDDLRFKREQLAYAAEQGLIVGSESGHDGALGAAHYFEGMQSPWVGRFEDSGYDLGTIKPASEAMRKWNLSPRYRAPLFDLAYHDRYVGYEYWGDAANRLPEHWRRKDLFSVLYAQPQLWVMDEERWKSQKEQALKSYRTWSPVVRHLFGQRMTDWKVLDKDGDVQETHWEDGSVVRVDFARDHFELKGPVNRAL